MSGLDPKTYNIIGKGNSIMGDTELSADEHPLYQRKSPMEARGFDQTNWAFQRAMRFYDEGVVYACNGTFPRSMYMQNVIAQLLNMRFHQEILEAICIGFARDYDLRNSSAALTTTQSAVVTFIRQYDFCQITNVPSRFWENTELSGLPYHLGNSDMFIMIHLVNCMQYIFTYRNVHGAMASPITTFCHAEINKLMPELLPLVGNSSSAEWDTRAKFSNQ